MSEGFSIITLTYNNTQDLDKFLINVENAKIKSDYEIIILDDSDKENAENIVKKYLHLPIKFYHLDERKCITEKRNNAVEKAQNELIISIDPDIKFNKQSIDKLIQGLKENPDAAMAGGKILQNGRQLHPTKYDRLLPKNNYFYTEVLYSPFLAFYKSAFEKVGRYNTIFENRGEGTDLSIKFWRAGYPIIRNLEAIVEHPPFEPQRKSPEMIAEMYKSLFLVSILYDLDPTLNQNFIKTYQERKEAYRETCEYYSIYTFYKYFDWFYKNHQRILDAKKIIPQEFDFRPFDIFTDKKILEKCLDKAQSKILSSYKKVFAD